MLIFLLLYSCGGSSNTQTTIGDNSDTQTTTKSVDTILIPLYSYPVGQYSQEWQKLYNFNTNKKVFVIVNVDSGPSEQPDSNYVDAISRLKTKGFYVVGYVRTLYANRDINLVKTHIDRWLQFYPNMIDGFFIDEVANQPDKYNYYADIYNYVKSKSQNMYVVLNPGTIIDASYWNISDKIVVFESPYGEFKNYNHSFNSQISSNVCIIVYGVPNITSFYEVRSKGFSINSSCQYITDYSDPDTVYFYLSNYLSLF